MKLLNKFSIKFYSLQLKQGDFWYFRKGIIFRKLNNNKLKLLINLVKECYIYIDISNINLIYIYLDKKKNYIYLHFFISISNSIILNLITNVKPHII